MIANSRSAKLKTSRINVTLDPDTVAAAKQLGNGNLSKGLRIAVKHSQQLERVLKQISEYRRKPEITPKKATGHSPNALAQLDHS